MKSSQHVVAGAVVALLPIASYGIYWTGQDRPQAPRSAFATASADTTPVSAYFARVERQAGWARKALARPQPKPLVVVPSEATDLLFRSVQPVEQLV